MVLHLTDKYQCIVRIVDLEGLDIFSQVLATLLFF